MVPGHSYCVAGIIETGKTEVAKLVFPFKGLAKLFGEPVVRFYDVLGLSSELLFAQNRHRRCVLVRMSFFLRFFVCFSEGSDP